MEVVNQYGIIALEILVEELEMEHEINGHITEKIKNLTNPQNIPWSEQHSRVNGLYKTTKAKMGTIEPIYATGDPPFKQGDTVDRMAFIRGCVEKYNDTPVDRQDIINYIKKMVK